MQTLSASVEEANLTPAPQLVPLLATLNRNCRGTLLNGVDDDDDAKSSRVSATASQPLLLGV